MAEAWPAGANGTPGPVDECLAGLDQELVRAVNRGGDDDQEANL